MTKTRWEVARRLASYLKGVRGPFLVASFFMLLIAILTASKAWIVEPVVDGFLNSEDRTEGQLVWICLGACAIFVFQAIFAWGHHVAARLTSSRLVYRIRRDLFRHLTRHSLGYFAERSSADITSRVVNDVRSFEVVAVVGFQKLIKEMVTVLLLLGVLFLWDWQLALLCLAVIFVAAMILRVTGGKVRSIATQMQQNLSKVTKHLIETIGGMELIMSCGMRERWRERFKKDNEDFARTLLGAEKMSANGTFVVLSIIGVTIAVVLWITGSAVLRGDLSIGEFMGLLAAIYLMQAPAETIPQYVAGIAKGMAAAGRAFQLFDELPALEEPKNPVALAKREGRVEFDGVSFSYKDEPVLSGLSFAVQPREIVVMVGDSGAGKSTVARLLLRFYDPAEGVVRIDGVSLPDLSHDTLYGAIGYVGQDVYHFDASVEFNLSIARPEASEEELWEALRLACLDRHVRSLPEGLAAGIGERGTRLSGGQRQRLAIARALLSDAHILVLDEATSALDMELEQAVLQNIVGAAHQRTVFAITHRLSLAQVADRVIVLKKGCLAEEGPAAVLAASGGEYARLCAAASGTLERDESDSRLKAGA